MHSVPSVGDARSIWVAIWGKGSSIPAHIVGVPRVGIIFLGAIGSVLWLDLAYGLLISIDLPLELLK
jgi:hypothetical protein